ncbi:ABC transporter ATP-binding protein [Marinobacterium rhizophilum]|uniref:ABC transporter ATP-binding protein n=1 Tax=Marinobacterium rhizophilum TaxID=420402 RepID=UPI001969C018|nr:ATP-binding cassette domain-containing protein [Marinobacterium rhizophilum]
MEPAHTTTNPATAPKPRVQGASTAVLLQGHNLGLYDQDRWVWRQLELAISQGERVALTGPSGSGKTALLRTLAGLAPATEGELELAQRGLQHWRMPEYRARVGYLPQRPELGDGDTVEAVLTAPFAYRAHLHQRYSHKQTRHALRMLGRGADFLQRRVDSLSGGEQQITALLRLLALQPLLLLLDEPTAALDKNATLEVERLLRAWQDEAPDRAWLWVSHDADQITRMAQRTVQLPWTI